MTADAAQEGRPARDRQVAGLQDVDLQPGHALSGCEEDHKRMANLSTVKQLISHRFDATDVALDTGITFKLKHGKIRLEKGHVPRAFLV